MTSELESLLNEVRLLYNRIVEAGEALHEGEPVTLAMRAVLEYLLRDGPATVPEIARSRSVTRQHIQVIVNSLLDQGLAVLEPNPSHKRSSLVALTREGERMIRRMRRREEHLYDRTDFNITEKQLRNAGNVLRRVREALSSEEPRR